ncbi:MAG: hypothetical protein E6J18_14790 [Chloroflexi bacterium]|nr:MAG: hypothetical protein E6J18_14790 [Chloroflexota bacterium]
MSAPGAFQCTPSLVFVNVPVCETATHTAELAQLTPTILSFASVSWAVQVAPPSTVAMISPPVVQQAEIQPEAKQSSALGQLIAPSE